MRIDCPVCGAQTIVNLERNVKGVNSKIEDLLLRDAMLEEGFAVVMNRIEKRLIEQAIVANNGNAAAAARALNMPVYAIRHLIEKHNIERKSHAREKKSQLSKPE